jgi:hypothetical protein
MRLPSAAPRAYSTAGDLRRADEAHRLDVRVVDEAPRPAGCAPLTVLNTPSAGRLLK